MSGEDRSWMDNRWSPQGRITNEFQRGVKFFVEFSRSHPEYLRDGKIRCPCVRCANKKVQTDGNIKMHLMKFGFVENYKRWTVHGETEIKKFHGKHIDEGDMFAAMHTRKGPLEERLTWASPASENFYGRYREATREKAISEGLISPIHDLDTRIPFQPEVWEATDITNSKSQRKRTKREDKIYDFREHGKQLNTLSSSSRSRSLLFYHSISQTSSDPDPEMKQLREEVSNLKEMMQQMQERQKKREQQQQEERRQLQQFMQKMMGGPLQHQQRLNSSFMSYFPPSGMYIPQQQQQLQPFHQQFIGQTLSSPNGGTGDPNFYFVGGVGGNGGVEGCSGSGSDSGGV